MSRLTASQALTPWDVAALRYGGSFLAVLPLVAWRGLPRFAPARLPVVLGCAGFGFPLFAYAGYQLAPAAHGAVVMAAGLPVAVALVGLAMRQSHIGRWQGLSLAVVVGGSLLLGAATSGVYAEAWRGDLLFVAGAVSWSIYTVLVQRWRLQAMDATLLIGLGAAPLYLPVWWLALPSRIAEAPWQVVATQGVFHGLGASVIAMLLYTRAVAAIGPGPTTMVGAVVPGLAALIAWPLLGEALPPLGLLAVALVSAGMLIGVLKQD
jgi:drug/metabolite transporter (DMT)-like permease